MPSVYIETTIPSFYHSTRKSIQALAWRAQTRIWWDRHRASYELCTSDAVLVELGNAPTDRAEPRIRLMEGVRVLSPSADVQRIAAYYMDNRLMPRSAGLDALHVAFASVHGIDFLLTWNCKHIANDNKTEHLAVLNKRLSLPIPIMSTPYTLIPEDRS
jgi:hypothetical protein